MTEIDEALEVFDKNINLGLSSTQVMGRVLAKAYRAAESKIKTFTRSSVSVESYKDALACSATLRATLESNQKDAHHALIALENTWRLVREHPLHGERLKDKVDDAYACLSRIISNAPVPDASVER